MLSDFLLSICKMRYILNCLLLPEVPLKCSIYFAVVIIIYNVSIKEVRDLCWLAKDRKTNQTVDLIDPSVFLHLLQFPVQ